MPLPAAHFRPVQSAVKTANAKVWGVAAATAQPLAALPPYGCGVPLAGSDRLVQSHSTAGGHWCTAALPDVSLRGAKRRGNLGEAVAARTSHRRPHALPNLTVAAFPAQPLAALPPYGCGVPFTGGERLWQLHISARLRRPCNAPGLSLRGGRRPTWRPEREARGSALGVQSREGSCDFADDFPVVRSGSARLPRRFAPRNDTSGECRGAPAPSCR